VAVQAILVLLAGVTVALLGPPFILQFLPQDYVGTGAIVPWLALGTTLFGLYLMPMNTITITAGVTRHVWIFTAIAATMNIALNILLVPSFGTAAAAINTTIGYGALLVGVFLYMRRVCNPPLPYDTERIAKGFISVALPALLSAMLTDPSSVSGLIIRALGIVGTVLVLILGPFRVDARSAIHAIRFRKPEGLA
jgi:O-antigen/teichoic acid export membrane protein